jgi:hypothetical protein
MFENLSERFKAYEFLYEQAMKETNPVKRATLLKNFDAFRAFVRADEKQEFLRQQYFKKIDDEMAEMIAEAAELESRDLVLQTS